MFLGIHTPAYSLIAQLDPTQRCFHHNSESQWSTCLMLFQLDFGGMVCGFQRNSGERKVCLVLVPALAGLWGDEQDEEQGQGEMDWLVGARSTHSWTCSSPSSTLQQQHNLPCVFGTALFQAALLQWINLQPSVFRSLACVYRCLYHRLDKFPAYSTPNVSIR